MSALWIGWLSLVLSAWTGGAARASAAADVVMVDGVGPVALAGFDCVSVARSALVGRVCHDAARGLAVAEVGGRHRAYCDVPRSLVDAWLAAPSMGRFHAERVASAHRCD